MAEGSGGRKDGAGDRLSRKRKKVREQFKRNNLDYLSYKIVHAHQVAAALVNSNFSPAGRRSEDAAAEAAARRAGA